MRCPQCDSNRPYRDGLRYLADGTIVQRWLCRNCGFRFTDPSKNSKSQTFHSYENGAHQKAAKLLVEAEKAYSEKREAGATSEYNPNSEIVNFAFWLRKQGYSDATIESRVKRLKRLTLLGADLHDPESVKEVISRQHGWSEGYKETVVEAYSSYLSMKGGKWNPPRYKRVPRLPHIPLEREIDQLIAFFPPKMACLLQLLKETGCRIGEAVRLTWRDIDLEAGTVRITPEKRSDPRIFRLSSILQAMLKRIQPQSLDDKIFPSQSCVEAYYYRRRKHAANRLCNPRLLQISLHTFRHWKATTEYAKTKDILYVMKLLGHRNIHNTLVYTQLVNFNDNEYICRSATTSSEADQLIEAGFEYVCTTPDGVMKFRKRK